MRKHNKLISRWMLATILLCAMILIYYGCSRSNRRAIIGKWEGVEGMETLEFLKDGSMNIGIRFDRGTAGLKVSGVYWFVGRDRISIVGSIRLLGDSEPPIICRVSVSGDELILTSPDGKVARYRRR